MENTIKDEKIKKEIGKFLNDYYLNDKYEDEVYDILTSVPIMYSKYKKSLDNNEKVVFLEFDDVLFVYKKLPH